MKHFNPGGVALAALGASVIISVSACGASGKAISSGPVKAVEDAYTTTMGAKTAQFAFTETVQASSTTGSQENQTVTGNGQADLAKNAFEMSINSPTGGAIKLLETGGTMYIQVPPSEQSQIPGNKPWASVDLNQVDEANLGKSFSQLASANNDSPTAALSKLQSISDRVTTAGTATINGVSTTEYKATVDLTKVAAQVKAKDGAQAARAVTEQQKDLGTSTLPVEVWIDANRMVRRYQTQIPLPAATTGATNGTGMATIAITFTGFGSPVNVAAPPNGQVANITSQVISQTKQSS